MSDAKIVLLMVGLHFLALGAAAALIIFALRSNNDEPPSDDEGRGGVKCPEPLLPRGGPPLASARPAQLRLRGPGRLADAHPRRRGREVEAPTPSPTRPARRDLAAGLGHPPRAKA